jgi:pimeloyl-ACP methyl ester carboxylesterase
MPSCAGIHYFFHRDGDANRPPVILIHGAGGNYLTWHPYLRRLQDETIYALDLPAHGESPGEGRRSIRDYADDVLRFLDAAKIQRAVFGGLSMGGAVALTLALDRPQRAAGLALIGGGAKMHVAGSILETAGNSETFEAAVETINANCFSPNASPDLVRLSKQQMLKMQPSVLLDDFLACHRFDVTGRLAEIQTPTLILCGALDKMMPPKFSESLRDGIPNARLRIVENAGHMLPLEQPQAVAEALRLFLDELPPHPAPGT